MSGAWNDDIISFAFIGGSSASYSCNVSGKLKGSLLGFGFGFIHFLLGKANNGTIHFCFVIWRISWEMASVTIWTDCGIIPLSTSITETDDYFEVHILLLEIVCEPTWWSLYYIYLGKTRSIWVISIIDFVFIYVDIHIIIAFERKFVTNEKRKNRKKISDSTSFLHIANITSN